MSQPTRKRKRNGNRRGGSDNQRVSFSVQMPIGVPTGSAVYRGRDITGHDLATWSPIFGLLAQARAMFKVTRMVLKLVRKSWQGPPTTVTTDGLLELAFGLTHETQSSGSPAPGATDYSYQRVLSFGKRFRVAHVTNYQLMMGTRVAQLVWTPKSANDFTFKNCNNQSTTAPTNVYNFVQDLNYTWCYVVLAGRNGTTDTLPLDEYDIVADCNVIFSGGGNSSISGLAGQVCLHSSGAELDEALAQLEREKQRRTEEALGFAMVASPGAEGKSQPGWWSAQAK